MRMWARAAGAAGMLGLAVAAADGRQKLAPSPADEKFAQAAASTGMAENEMGKVAKTRARDPEVKQFADRVLADHAKAAQELKAVAQELRVKLPTRPGPDDQKHVDKVKGFKGKEFDRDFLAYQAKFYEDAERVLARGAQEAQSEKLKAVAGKLGGVLREHAGLAKKLQDKLDKK